MDGWNSWSDRIDVEDETVDFIANLFFPITLFSFNFDIIFISSQGGGMAWGTESTIHVHPHVILVFPENRLVEREAIVLGIDKLIRKI